MRSSPAENTVTAKRAVRVLHGRKIYTPACRASLFCKYFAGTRSVTDRTFGERLAQARRILSVREWRDVTLAEIGDLVGKSGATISRYEAGLMPVPKAVAIALESVLPFPPTAEQGGAAPVVTKRKRSAPLADPGSDAARAAKGKRAS